MYILYGNHLLICILLIFLYYSHILYNKHNYIIWKIVDIYYICHI